MKPASARATSTGFAFLAIASLGWGLNWPVMKHLLTELPPLTARGLSGVAGAVALAMIALAWRQNLKVPRHLWPRLIAISWLTIGAWVAFIGMALVWLNAGEAAVLASSGPVWVSLLAWPILRERFSLLRAVALIVAMTGLAVLFGANSFDARIEKLPGVAFAIAGALCWALGTVLTKRFPLQLPPVSLAAWQVALGCLPVAAIGLAIEQPDLSALSGVGWASLGYMTLMQFCVCYVCWFAALERLPASTASIATLLVPVVGVMASAAMLHEPLGVRELLALTLTLAGVVIAARS